MNVEELSTIIEKEFYYLFEKYNFKEVYRREHRLNHNSIGIESNKCRILFKQEGGVNILIGPKEYPFNDIQKWISLKGVVNYLQKQSMDWKPDKKNQSLNNQVIYQLSSVAHSMKPLCQQIFDMFSSQESILQWKSEYDRYIDEQIEKRFGI